MSVGLTVSNPISSGTPQPVADQQGNQSGLRLASQIAQVVGRDVAGGSMPMMIIAEPVAKGQTTHNRILRLRGASGFFFDIGIDDNGTLFVNSSKDEAGAPPMLSITQAGEVSIKKLVLPNLTQASVHTDDVTADSKGNLYKQ